MNRSSVIVIVLFIFSLVVGAFEFYLNSLGEFETSLTQTTWGLVFLVLTVVWAMDDAKKQKFDIPFDFGFLIYIFWPIAFPYYLISTRRTEGLLHVAGFLALWQGPWLAGLVAYVYFYE